MKQAAAWINHRLYHWNSSCLLLVQSSKWKVICKEQELLLTGWSLPGDVGRGRARKAQLSDCSTCTNVTVTHLYWLLKPVCCFGNKEAVHRGTTSGKALCSRCRGQKLPQEPLLGLLSLDLSLVSCCHEKDRSHLSQVLLVVMCLQWVQQSAQGTDSEMSSNLFMQSWL